LAEHYPEYNFDAWKFKHFRVPSFYWSNVKNQRDLFDRIATTLSLSTWEDWYKVQAKQVLELGGRSVMKYYQLSLPKGIETKSIINLQYCQRLLQSIQNTTGTLVAFRSFQGTIGRTSRIKDNILIT
jgi:hypothetical protein